MKCITNSTQKKTKTKKQKQKNDKKKSQRQVNAIQKRPQINYHITFYY